MLLDLSRAAGSVRLVCLGVCPLPECSVCMLCRCYAGEFLSAVAICTLLLYCAGTKNFIFAPCKPIFHQEQNRTLQLIANCNGNGRRTLQCKCKEKRKWTMNDKDKRQATSSIGTCIWRKLHLPRNNNNRPLLYHGQMDNINININIT